MDVWDYNIVESELYVNYEIIYDGKNLRISRWNFSTEKEDNCCEIIGKRTICRYGKEGDYLCKIFLKEEEASEELARKTAAELIAKYKIEHADADSSLVDEYLIKIKKEI